MAYLIQTNGDTKRELDTFRIAKELNCKMANAKTPDDWKAVLSANTFDEEVAPLVFPMLWESLNPPPGNKKNPAPAPANVRTEDLKASLVLMNYIEARIRDPKMPAISKIEWYFFIRDKLSSPNKSLAEIVATEAQAFFIFGLPNKLPGPATIALEGLHRDLERKLQS